MRNFQSKTILAKTNVINNFVSAGEGRKGEGGGRPRIRQEREGE